MALELLMGNQAIALGAIRAGVQVVCGYPGTPSTEVLETIAQKKCEDLYVEWSVNEKSAMEIAAGAAYAGKRSLVTMKQMGLNVASDPLMCLSYVGVKAGMVVLVADDPGPISSQTEQDTRYYGGYSKVPVFDPSSPAEAYRMIGDAFDFSQKHGLPVLLRPTTRVCHACESIEVDGERNLHLQEGFVKDKKWVIFPRLSYQAHLGIGKREALMQKELSCYEGNRIEESGENRGKGIAAGGISYAYVKDALTQLDTGARLLKISTPYPFPEQKALEFLKDLKEVLVVEELDPVIERELIFLCGKYHLPVTIKGKLTGHTAQAGENSVDLIKGQLGEFLGKQTGAVKEEGDLPALPERPPTLCAGCPHRASFYAVKKAMSGKKAVFCGDIGCYTLGNAQPLDMVDTCLCMGAGLTMAQGIRRAQPDTTVFGFIGDSTFFHTGISGILDAVYNKTSMVAVILDNSTTAMTGHQPHPGTGVTMMGVDSQPVSIPAVLKGLGVKHIQVVDPLELDQAIEAVKRAASEEEVSAIVFKSPCIAIAASGKRRQVDRDVCTGCRLCIKELGCPALVKDGDKVGIDRNLCYGCGLCEKVCPFHAIGGEGGC